MKKIEAKILSGWDAIVDFFTSWHKDAVANVVIYSSISLLFGVIGMCTSAAGYRLVDIPCETRRRDVQLEYFDTNDVIGQPVGQVFHNQLDGCLIFIGVVFSAVTVIFSAVGIIAGELNKKRLYIIFGSIAFLAAFLEGIY